jgi:hypothetical protein
MFEVPLPFVVLVNIYQYCNILEDFPRWLLAVFKHLFEHDSLYKKLNSYFVHIFLTSVVICNVNLYLFYHLQQILCFWTLSIVLSLFRNRPVYFSKHNVSETGFCLCLQVKPTQLSPIDRASPYY